jgi:hypothetical protein
MADYFSILNKTIAGLPSNTAETRQFVYAKARQAIESRLKAINPPPGKDAIEKQMQVLEEAVRRIEAEQVLQELMSAPDPEPEKVPPPPQPAAKIQAVPQPNVEVAPKREPVPPQAPPLPPQPGPARNGNGNSSAAPLSQARQTPQPRVGPPAYDSSLDSLDTLDRSTGRPGKVRREDTRRRGSGGWIGAVLSFLMLALLAGGAYALWLNKEPLIQALGIGSSFGLGDSGGQDTQAQNETRQTEAAQDQANADEEEGAPADEVPEVRQANEAGASNGKEDIRLDESGNSVPGQQVAGANESGAGTESGSQLSAEGQQDQAQQVNPVNEGQQAGADTQDGAQTSGDQAAAPAIGQKAFLYEEGSAGAGATRDNAAVVWSLVQEPPAEGLPPEAVIRGQFDVPGRGVTMQLSIKRNSDEALPASHVIELLFSVPADFSGGNVDNVARFVMKASEQARGEGLVAVPARIDAGYFLIALNNLPQAVDTNRKLLLESSWIDVPLGYTSGRRALVALEKGAIGDKVFRDAFADWDKR